MGLGNSPPYYLRLRIFAKLTAYFYAKLRDLPPVYDNCPVKCLAPQADKANNCPDCDYTIFYEQFRANYYKLLTKEFRQKLEESDFSPEKAHRVAEELAGEDWSFEDMANDYRILSGIESLAGAETEISPGASNPDWNVRTDLAIQIIREERYKARRDLDFQKDEKRKAEAKARELSRRGAV